jgi:SOS response regulatory protein OraA/RecX
MQRRGYSFEMIGKAYQRVSDGKNWIDK